jgi:hypothetical protein
MVDKDTARIDNNGFSNGDELRLEPPITRPQPLTIADTRRDSRGRQFGQETVRKYPSVRNPHTSLFGMDYSVVRSTEAIDVPPLLRQEIKPPSAELESERNYSSIKVLQRSLRLFGYVTIVIGPLFLASRFVFLMYFASDDLSVRFPAFLLYSFWVLTSTVFASATFFACCEFFQLVMDVQWDTFAESKLESRDS